MEALYQGIRLYQSVIYSQGSNIQQISPESAPKMKVSPRFIIAALCAVSRATPTPTYEGKPQRGIENAATASDKATLGYATLNGGYVISCASISHRLRDSDDVCIPNSTHGGSDGNITIVSTLAEFTAAVAENNTAPAIVVVQGVIAGSSKVRIGSNKTIIGLPGSGMLSFLPSYINKIPRAS